MEAEDDCRAFCLENGAGDLTTVTLALDASAGTVQFVAQCDLRRGKASSSATFDQLARSLMISWTDISRMRVTVNS